MRYIQLNKNTNVKALQQTPPIVFVPKIPLEITVHLGPPDEEAKNITVPYVDYIKNVGSSELYPTWPENALRANIHAITSIAMNRIYTEWYRARGYDFDITNSTQYDQAFVSSRGIFDTISVITDEIFSQYIVREGQISPFFAEFCDGRISQCNGMQQWGSVDLANAGYSSIEILRYYYGEDITIVTNAPVGSVEATYPGEPLELGDSSLDVLRMQLYLDRIRVNFPAIPKIEPLDGYFNESTQEAVRVFQGVFDLPQTGVIDETTWYRIIYTYAAVTRLAEITAEGILLSELSGITEELYLEGDVRSGVSFIQYFLNVLSAFYTTIPEVTITGIFDEQTRLAILEFQKVMGLPQTGAVDSGTINALYNSAVGILETLTPQAVYLPSLRWPGIVYELGHESPGVYIIQEMLSYISIIIPVIPYIEPSGVYDDATRQAVIAFQNIQGLEPTGVVDEATWNAIVEVYRQQRYGGGVVGIPIV